jgi:hypothetical protein
MLPMKLLKSRMLVTLIIVFLSSEKTAFITIIKNSSPTGHCITLMICVYVGFQCLYAMLVCVACSQLEKLRAAILDIRQTHVTSEQDCGAETDQQEGQRQIRTSEELFSHMRKQLNDCIRHHQQIIRCVYN